MHRFIDAKSGIDRKPAIGLLKSFAVFMHNSGNNTPNNTLRFWIGVFAMLCIGVGFMSITIKGFHLFNADRLEPFIQGADDTHYYTWLRSMVVDGDYDFENDFRETPFLDPVGKKIALEKPLTETGLLPNKFPVGWAVLTLPLFWFVHLLLQLLGFETTGYEPIYQICVWLQQVALAGVGMWVLWRLLRRWFEPRIALLAIMSGWLASSLVYYQTARVSMAHNSVVVLAVVVYWLAFQIKDALVDPDPTQKRSMLFLGLATGVSAGLMVICRPSALVYLIFPLAVILQGIWQSYRHKPGAISAMISGGILGSFTGIFPQLLAWKYLYGHWVYYSYKDEGFNWGEPQFLESLFGNHHGLFNWHPALAIGLIGLSFATIGKKFPWPWIFSFGLIVWANSAWHMVHFGSAFGGRAYEFITIFSMIGNGFLIHWSLGKRWLLHGLMTLFVLMALWNAGFLYAYMQGYVHREDPVSWIERFSGVFNALF